MASMTTLGLKLYGHDSAAAIVLDGKIMAAISQERLDRKKHSGAFPFEAIFSCLETTGIRDINDVDEIVISFNYLKVAFLFDIPSFFSLFPTHILETLGGAIRETRKYFMAWFRLRVKLGYRGRIRSYDHHDCHAAAAYYVSSFDNAAILTIDARGEYASTCIYAAQEANFSKQYQIKYPNSLGVFYLCITEYLGFKALEDEGKVMGLAPYGTTKLVNKMRKVLQVSEGTFRFDPKYFEYSVFPFNRLTDYFLAQFGPARKKEEPINQRHKDVARAAQVVLEDALLELARHAKKETKSRNLCLSGGVALNSVANSRILRAGIFENIYIYPAAGDDGASVGAALLAYYRRGNKRVVDSSNQSPYLGPSSTDRDIMAAVDNKPVNYVLSERVIEDTSKLLAENKFVGWYQERAEFGPRALGNRSILASPLIAENKDLLNARVKFREPFRPFAPAVLEEAANDYFEMQGVLSPYMILAFPVSKDKIDVIPAVTHIDRTARVQTVSKHSNLNFWMLIRAFERQTGVPVLLNTSFNVMGQPIVNTPDQAISCLLDTGLDAVVIGNYIITKRT
jgi:carbamoyltransferase